MKTILDVLISAKDVTGKAFQSVSQRAASLGKSIASGLGGAMNFAKKFAAAVAVVGAAAVAAAKKAISAYQIQAASEAKLAQVLKSTGFAAGKTATELKSNASALQKLTGVGDETIISMQALLATFVNIKGDKFDEATMAVLDMSAAMKKAGADSAEVEQTAIQVGKALNDPIQGYTALRRVGVSFTDAQVAQIKALQESGDLAGAQAIILRELQTEFGGVAAAVNKSSHGMMGLKAALGDGVEAIGQAIVETDGFDSIIGKVTAAIENLTQSGLIDLWAENIRKAISGIMPLVEKVGNAFGWVGKKIEEAAAFWGGFAGAQGGIGARIQAGAEAKGDVPGKLKAERDARLTEIRARKQAAKDAALASEKEAMAKAEPRVEVGVAVDAKAIDKLNEELTKQRKMVVDLEVTGAPEDILSRAKAETDALAAKIGALSTPGKEGREDVVSKEAEENAQRLGMAKELAANIKAIEQDKQEQAVKAMQDAADKQQSIIEKTEKALAKVTMTREERRAEEQAKQDEKRAARKEKDLKARLTHKGTTLSKESMDFLEARKLEREMKDALDEKAKAEANVIARQKELERERHAETLKELKATNALLIQNLQAAGG